jgi:hypothetical protein
MGPFRQLRGDIILPQKGYFHRERGPLCLLVEKKATLYSSQEVSERFKVGFTATLSEVTV